MLIVGLLLYVFAIRIIFTSLRAKGHKLELFLYILAIFIYIAFRDYSVGADTAGYCKSFLNLGKIPLKEAISEYSKDNEIGYILFVKLLYSIFPYDRALLIVQGLMVSVCYGIFIKNWCSKNYFLATLIFMSFGLFSFHLTGIRQSLAMSLCVVGYNFFMKKKYIRTLIFIALGTVFHFSSLLFLSIFLFIPLPRIYNIFVAVIIGAIFALLASQLLKWISTWREKWEIYSQIEETGNGYIFFAILMIISIFAEFQKKEFDKTELRFSNINYISIILWSGRLISRTFERPALYFAPTQMPLLINSIYSLKEEKDRQFFYVFAILLITAFYLYRYVGMGYTFCF